MPTLCKKKNLRALACPFIGIKWWYVLFFDLGAKLSYTSLSCFLASTALLKPVNMPQPIKNNCSNLHRWILMDPKEYKKSTYYLEN
jgi:hypothetical protein